LWPPGVAPEAQLARRARRVGDVLVAQGKLDEALKSYRADLEITQRLAPSDRSNTQWQRDLANSHVELATIYEKLGDIAQALAELRVARTIMAALVPIAPGYVQWQRDLAWLDREIARLEARCNRWGGISSRRSDRCQPLAQLGNPNWSVRRPLLGISGNGPVQECSP
jgi:tetratricopeptide (TPR) repeat protein